MWALELLLHLKRSAPRRWSRKQLIYVLRGSQLIVDQSVDGLLRAGLIAVETDDTVRFQAATPELARLTDQVEREYVTRPDAVRRLIVSGAHKGLATFAEASRLWRNDVGYPVPGRSLLPVFCRMHVVRIPAGSNLYGDAVPAAFLERDLFALLALNNRLVVLDLVVFPQLDLRTARALLAFAGISVLLIGFIWGLEAE